MVRAALVASLSLIALWAAPALAFAQAGHALGFSPYWDWKTLESERFRVTFPAGLEDTAQKSAAYLEEAHRLLAPFLAWEPAFRTQVVLVDNADAANGLTTPVG